MVDPSQTGVIAEAAVQPDQNVSQSGMQPEQEQMVPVTALQAERRERQQLQENNRILQDHLALLQANAPKQASEAQQGEFSGLSDSDVLTVGDAKKFMNQFSHQQNLAVEELKMQTTNPDYNEVVRKYLPEVLKTDPELKDVIMNAPNPYKAAYFIAKRSDGYLQEQRLQKRSPEAQQAVHNLQRPGNLSSVGQGVSGTAASNFKSMSDKDFMTLANKNLGYT